jgi:hypothetical protein
MYLEEEKCRVNKISMYTKAKRRVSSCLGGRRKKIVVSEQ